MINISSVVRSNATQAVHSFTFSQSFTKLPDHSLVDSLLNRSLIITILGLDWSTKPFCALIIKNTMNSRVKVHEVKLNQWHRRPHTWGRLNPSITFGKKHESQIFKLLALHRECFTSVL